MVVDGVASGGDAGQAGLRAEGGGRYGCALGHSSELSFLVTGEVSPASDYCLFPNFQKQVQFLLRGRNGLLLHQGMTNST